MAKWRKRGAFVSRRCRYAGRAARKGQPLALVTNKPTPFVAPILASLDIAKYFTVVIGGDDVKKQKTAPGTAASGRGETGGLAPADLLFVGDSRNDIQAAKAGLQLDRPDLRLQLRRADFAERAGLYL